MQGFIKRIEKKENPLFWILVFWVFGNGFDVQHVLKLGMKRGHSQGQKGIYSTNLGLHSMVAKHRTVVNKCSRVWLFACPVILCFCLSFDVYFFALWTRLGLLHLLAFGMTHCICVQSLYPMGIHLLRCVHDGRGLHPMMPFRMLLHPL